MRETSILEVGLAAPTSRWAVVQSTWEVGAPTCVALAPGEQDQALTLTLLLTVGDRLDAADPATLRVYFVPADHAPPQLPSPAADVPFAASDLRRAGSTFTATVRWTGSTEVALHRLQVALGRASDAGFELFALAALDVAVLPGPGAAFATGAPADLVRLVARLSAGTTDAAGALVRFVNALPYDEGHRLLYRGEGATFIVDGDGVVTPFLDALLAVALRPGRKIAVDCRAMSALLACVGTLLDEPIAIAHVRDGGFYLPTAGLATNRVLPLGDSDWQYATPSGVFDFHRVVVRGAGDTPTVFDASFRVDVDTPHLRPHSPDPVAGMAWDVWLQRLVPEASVGAWRVDPPRWPSLTRLSLSVQPIDNWIRRTDETPRSFLDRVRREAPEHASAALVAAAGDDHEPVVLCVLGDQVMAVLEGPDDPIEVVIEPLDDAPTRGATAVLAPSRRKVGVRAVGRLPGPLHHLHRRVTDRLAKPAGQ